MPELDVIDRGLARLALRTPTLPPATTTNTLIVGERRLAVIEPATPEPAEQAALNAAIAAKIAAGGELVAIIITHHHGDHVAYADGLRRRFGGRVLAHRATAERVSFAVDGELEDGDTIELGERVIEALFTPGHAPGHLVLREKSTGIAYAGDLVAGEGTILIDPEDDGDMGEYLRSLRRVADLGLRALIPAHGPVITSPGELLARYITHRLMREAKLVAALDGGPLPRQELLARVYDDAPRYLWPLADRSLEAHIRKLEGEGRLHRHGGVIRSSTAD
ncbi:MAG: MBL fold metallo-hydrolase [Nannocystaceae bacterium]